MNSYILNIGVRDVLRLLYYVGYVLTYPIDVVWEWLFCCHITCGKLMDDRCRIVVTSSTGGAGKTTVSKEAARVFGVRYVSMDSCKYGEKWKRYTPEEVRSQVAQETRDNRYVLDGVYHDPKLPEQRHIFDEHIATADLSIFIVIPLWVSVWRKLFRSFKRAIGVGDQGAAPETWENVKAMIHNTYTMHHVRSMVMEEMLAREHRPFVFRYPYYPRIVL